MQQILGKVKKWVSGADATTKALETIGITYLLIPVIIFILGWVKLPIALPLAVLLCALIIFLFIHTDFGACWKLIQENPVKFLIGAAVIFVWVYLSGIGGFSYQNTDHTARNATLYALIDEPWPLVMQDMPIVYYLGFWLPSALVGKLFGLAAAKVFLFVWAYLGVFWCWCYVCENWLKRISFLALSVFILFSGLDVLGVFVNFLSEGVTFLGDATAHIEWWSGVQLSSVTSQLFWVFNQALPAWVATLLVLGAKKSRNIALIVSTLVLLGTFPGVGLLCVGIAKVLTIERKKKGTLQNFLQNTLTPANVLGVAIALITGLYILSSQRMDSPTVLTVTDEKTFKQYLWFVAFESLPFLLLLVRTHKKNFVFWTSMLAIMIFPLINISNAPTKDFGMRGTIPPLIVLMVLVIVQMDEWIKTMNKNWLFVSLLILAIGATTPLNEIRRTVIVTISAKHTEGMALEQEPDYGWLVSDRCAGDWESFFFSYLAKK